MLNYVLSKSSKSRYLGWNFGASQSLFHLLWAHGRPVFLGKSFCTSVSSLSIEPQVIYP